MKQKATKKKKQRCQTIPIEYRATPKQLSYLKFLLDKKEFTFIKPKLISKEDASFMIDYLIKLNRKHIS